MSGIWARGRTFVATFLPRSAVILASLTLGAYVMGLVRDRVFTHTFGLGPELDAYNAAFVLPELALDVLVAGGLVAPFVPLFTGLRVGGKDDATGPAGQSATDREDAAAAFGRTILTLAVLVMAVAAAFLFVFASQTVELIAPGFQGDQRELYTNLFRIMCVTPVIFGASIVLGEILVAERRFVAYGLAPLFYNGGIVAGTLLLADRIGIYAAAYGAVAGALLHLGIRLVGIRRSSFRLRPSLAIRTPAVGSFIRLMIPKMASHPIEPLTFLYFTAIASNLEPGSIASVSLARNFQSVAVSLIGAAFSIAAFPALSAAAALGDRRGFSRLFGRTFATIVGLTLLAAIGVFVVGGFVIRLFLGGGAFDDDAIDRTTALLLVFAISIPLESLTHLLSRAIYATRNTLVPSAASVAGFAATVISADALLPSLGVAAIPASFAVGMAVKVVILGIALVPRIRGIGADPEAVLSGSRTAPVLARPMATPFVGPFAGPTAGALARRPSTRRRLGTVVLAVAVVGLGLGVVRAASLVVSTNTLGIQPAITPRLRSAAPAATEPPASEVPILAEVSPSASPSDTPGPSGTAPGVTAPPPSPTPTPGPFKMDLYEKGDYVGEQYDTWCLPAAMQVSMNIMDVGADTTLATQRYLFNLARSIDPAPDGAAEPEAWATGLTQLGYGKYEVKIVPSIHAAVQLAAARIRATNRPAGFMVWRGAHSWVMSGFSATADPAVTDKFTVTGVRIEDVWYPRFSTIWGYSRPPDALVAVKDLDLDFLPWKRPKGSYPDKDGQYVIIVPVR